MRVWRLEAGQLVCLVVGTGHTEAVLGLVLANQSINQLYSVSKVVIGGGGRLVARIICQID